MLFSTLLLLPPLLRFSLSISRLCSYSSDVARRPYIYKHTSAPICAMPRLFSCTTTAYYHSPYIIMHPYIYPTFASCCFLLRCFLRMPFSSFPIEAITLFLSLYLSLFISLSLFFSPTYLYISSRHHIICFLIPFSRPLCTVYIPTVSFFSLLFLFLGLISPYFFSVRCGDFKRCSSANQERRHLVPPCSSVRIESRVKGWVTLGGERGSKFACSMRGEGDEESKRRKTERERHQLLAE